MTRIQVEVIRSACAGYANCLDAAPHIFDLDEHDIAVVAEAVYSEEHRATIEDAAHRCPAKAIVLTDEPSTGS